MLASDTGSVQQAKLVLLGDMGAGKSSLVLRFVKGQFFDYQVGYRAAARTWKLQASCEPGFLDAGLAQPLSALQESTIGAAFLTKTLPEHNVKFEIWWASNYSTQGQHSCLRVRLAYAQHGCNCRDTAGQERYHSLAPMYYR